MSNKRILFRNYDRTAVKHLLKEIGENVLRRECDNRHLSFPKRLAQFYLEENGECAVLKYDYPNTGASVLMKLHEYDLPEKGWERFSIIEY